MGGGTGTDCGTSGVPKIKQGEHTFEVGQQVMLSKSSGLKIATDFLRRDFGEGPFEVVAVQDVVESGVPFDDKVGIAHHQNVMLSIDGVEKTVSGALLMPYQQEKNLGFLASTLIFLISGTVSFIIFNSNFEFSIFKSVIAGLLIALFLVFAYNIDFSDPARDPNDAAYM
jgi:hypothetical protein